MKHGLARLATLLLGTLAVVLLDLAVDGQSATSLVGALNPTANDKAFTSTAPYLAAPHTP